MDIKTNFCQATSVSNKATVMDHRVNNTIAFIMETVETSAMVQGDNEPILQALGETVASKIRGIQTRHSPAYSSQSQASIERLHRTLFWTGTCHQRANGINYGFLVGMQRPVMAYLIKHSVFSSTTTSSTVMEDFFKDGSQATTLLFVSLEKTFVGVRGQVIKTTTTNRQIKAWKYNRQLMEIINGTPWAPSPSRYNSDFVLPSTTSTPKQTEDKDITTQQQTPAIEESTPYGGRNHNIKQGENHVSQGVFEDITLDQPTKEEKGNIIVIGSKWVLRNKWRRGLLWATHCWHMI